MIFDFWAQLSPDTQSIVLRIGVGLVALVLIWILRRVLASVLGRPLTRLSQSNPFIAASLTVADVPIRYFIIAAGLLAASALLGFNDTWVLLIVRTLFLIGLFIGIYQIVGIVGVSRAQLQEFTGIIIEEELLPFIRTALRLVVLAVAAVIVMQTWGYDVSGLVAGLGLGGLAFSLAAQDTIANLFGFTAVVGDRPFVEGESIKTDAVEGVVEHVGIRSTRVRQIDQSLVIVPNSRMANAPITNWSRLRQRHFKAVLWLDYSARSADLRKLLDTIHVVLSSRPMVERHTIQVFFTELHQSAVKIEVSCMVKLVNVTQFAAESQELNFKIMEAVENSPLVFKGSDMLPLPTE